MSMPSCCSFLQAGCPPAPCRPAACATTALRQPYPVMDVGTVVTTTADAAVGTGLRVAVPCTATLALVFSGSLALAEDVADATIGVYIQFYNVLTPTAVTSALPATLATLSTPVAWVPLTAALDVTLTPGTYVFNVMLHTTADTEVFTQGTLNGILTRAPGLVSAPGCC
jgi:hypothetical protein